VLGAGMLIGALSVLTFGDRFRRVGFDHPAA
jgi:hypothetical protein